MSAARRAGLSFRPPAAAVPSRWLFAFVAVASFGAVAAALVSQHVYGMDPCPWCVLERLLFVAIGIFALLGLAWRRPAGSRVAGTFALLLAVAGFAAAMWQHFVAAKSASCNLTLADRIMTATQLDQLLARRLRSARQLCRRGSQPRRHSLRLPRRGGIRRLRHRGDPRPAPRRLIAPRRSAQSSIGVLSATSSAIADSTASIADSE